jgi:hypothetical protein
MVTAPTNEVGNAGVGGFGLAVYRASIDEVVDLTWPTSVKVYDRMRRSDSKVSATLRAMFLPLLSGDWRINPRQARPEVVELVAESLGLPILDAGAEPPRRTRDRFDWAFHLRHALLSRVYGFMPFEQVYRIDADGFARIRKLAPRMPHTLTAQGLKIADDGGLDGIEQYGSGRGQGTVFISSDRLVMHSHEREGANWYGQSILRSVYRDWLLKDTYHRIAAIGIDRHGAGVPIYTDAPPDEVANPAQEALAGQQLAEGYRVGENAGGRIPHGAAFKLLGVEGQLPDILNYVRYHDEQIAANTLEMFSTLPSAPNGSRALGDTLVNFFTMALNAHGNDVATVTTNHVVEDLVDLNWGENEAAPAVECGPIGADQQITATALRQLIAAGAIDPDASLKRHLRRFYALPDPEAEPESPAIPRTESEDG